MTAAEYEPVLLLAATIENGKPIGEPEAMRRLIEAGALSMGLRQPPSKPP